MMGASLCRARVPEIGGVDQVFYRAIAVRPALQQTERVIDVPSRRVLP